MASLRRFVPVSEWTDPRQTRGRRGEEEAMAFLVSRGWEVEAHRYRLVREEVDLIVRRGRLVAFVEVKTRRSGNCGDPLEAVSARKRSAIARVAQFWTLRFGMPDDTYRFDLVAVRWGDDASLAVEHIEDAWRLGNGFLGRP